MLLAKVSFVSIYNMEQNRNETVKKSLLIALVAIIIGFAFNYLFFSKEIGISLAIFVLILCGSVYFLAQYLKKDLRYSWLLFPMAFFAIMPSIRANLLLTVLNVLAIFGLILIMTRVLNGESLKEFRFVQYILTIVVIPFGVLYRAVTTLWTLVGGTKLLVSEQFSRYLKGALIALPVLIVFALLLSSADLAFNQLLLNTFSINISEQTVAKIVWFVIVAIGSIGVLTALFIKPISPKLKIAYPSEPLKTPSIEVGMFLGLVAGLFGVFIIFQISYLFGGMINITNSDFTYAEYARKGFWELLVVSLAVLAILLAIDSYTERIQNRLKWFVVPSMIIVFEVIIMIISAFKRLMLYQSTYGLTTLRLYVAAFIILLGVIFVMVIGKLLYKKVNNWFWTGLLSSVISFIVIMNLINPDFIIAKNQVQRFDETGKVDSLYLSGLSADALPVLIDFYPQLNSEDKAIFDTTFNEMKIDFEQKSKNWQSYNVSRASAFNLLNDFQP